MIDHSVQVDSFGGHDSFRRNVELEYQRNGERYAFLRWGQGAFDNFRVVPPGTGICHQVNLENLAQVVWTAKDGNTEIAYPDTLVGTDSHTTMVNGLGVLGWGVGGIEAEAAMLGQPVSMLIPEVVGFKLTGKLPEGTTATDLVLTVTQMLRAKGVVGKFVEFFGAGRRPAAARRPGDHRQHGARIRRHLRLLPDRRRDARLSAPDRPRRPQRIALVEAYAKAQGMWRVERPARPGLHRRAGARSRRCRAVAGRPEAAAGPGDRCRTVKDSFAKALPGLRGDAPADKAQPIKGMDAELRHGDVVIAAITSCTNTSNPERHAAAGPGRARRRSRRA